MKLMNQAAKYGGGEIERYLRDTTLAEIYDVDRSTIWRWSRNGTLPPPIKLSEGVSRWLASEIERHQGAA